MTALSRSTIDRLATLARLELDDAEAEALVHDLSRILEHVDTLAELDLDDVPPTTHAGAWATGLRDDVPRGSLPRELALREAPRVVDDGFAVPAFVDEG
jgi:aspartyl-tRNA(Asn)/glutamyl-tRNA(Gln) amidotransferase subunit C